MATDLVHTRDIPTILGLTRTESTQGKDPPVHRGEKTPRSSWRAQYWKKATPWVRIFTLAHALASSWITSMVLNLPGWLGIRKRGRARWRCSRAWGGWHLCTPFMTTTSLH